MDRRITFGVIAFIISAMMFGVVLGNVHGYSNNYNNEWTPWAMFRHDSFHTGLSNYSTANNTGNLRWKFSTGYGIYSSPAIGKDGTIYVGSNDTYLYAISPSGELKWKFKTDGKVFSSPAIGKDGTIYVGSEDGNIYAISPTGKEKWSYSTGGAVDSSPAIGPDGTIYIGSRGGKMYALSPDGTLKWKFKIPKDAIDSTPAIGKDGTIYFGSEDHKIYAVNPDGSQKWNFTTGGGVASSPAIGKDGTIYVGSYDGYLYALNSDGSPKWKFQLYYMVDSSPAIGKDGTIYIGSWDGNLYAINPDGTLKWTYKTDGRIRSSPAISSDGTIYFGSCDNYTYALNPQGTLKWKFETGYWVLSSPAIGADGTVYVGSCDDNLYAIGVTPPLPPDNLKAEAGFGKVNLTWSVPISDGGAKIKMYRIYRGTNAGEESFLCNVSGSLTSFTDLNVSAGTTYYYYVTAVNSVGESDKSNEVNATPLKKLFSPSAPQNLKANAGNGYVELSWNPPSNDGGATITVYKIYRGTSMGTEQLIAEVNGTQTWYNDTTVKNGITYYYYVTAVNSVGESDKSNEVEATPTITNEQSMTSGANLWIIIGIIAIIIAIVGYFLLQKKKK